MKLFVSSLLLIVVWPVAAQQLKPFKSDGCSMFPDRMQVLGDWCSCCVDHDIAYWQGGTKFQKDSADQCLRECVWSVTFSDALADAMYRGVEVGGSAFFPTWYRWGYGWKFGRGYDSLSVSQLDSVQMYLNRYFSILPVAPCK